MTRKRIRNEKILNDSKRNATLDRRTTGLLKKAKELETLCGVEVGVVIQIPQEDLEGGINNMNTIVTWPSPTIFNDRLGKFLDFPPSEIAKKMVTKEEFLEQLIAQETEAVAKAKERMHLKEAHLLMKQLSQGKPITEFDHYQLNCLSLFSATMLEQLDKREADLKKEQQQQPHPESQPLTPSTVAFLDNFDIDYHQSMEEKINRILRGEKAP